MRSSVKVAVPRKGAAAKLCAHHLLQRLGLGDGGHVSKRRAMMPVHEAMKTIPGEYWESRPNLCLAWVTTSYIRRVSRVMLRRSNDCTFGPKGRCRCQLQSPACNSGSENMAAAVHRSLFMRSFRHEGLESYDVVDIGCNRQCPCLQHWLFHRPGR